MPPAVSDREAIWQHFFDVCVTRYEFAYDGRDWWYLQPNGTRFKAERPELINEACGWPPAEARG